MAANSYTNVSKSVFLHGTTYEEIHNYSYFNIILMDVG